MVSSYALDGDQLKLAEGVEPLVVSKYVYAGRVLVSEPPADQPEGGGAEGGPP